LVLKKCLLANYPRQLQKFVIQDQAGQIEHADNFAQVFARGAVNAHPLNQADRMADTQIENATPGLYPVNAYLFILTGFLTI